MNTQTTYHHTTTHAREKIMSSSTKELRDRWEQLAYDDGQASSRAGKPLVNCPFDNLSLVRAWQDGHVHTTLRRQFDLRIDTTDAETMAIATRERCAKCFGAVSRRAFGKKLSLGCVVGRSIVDCGGPYNAKQIKEEWA